MDVIIASAATDKEKLRKILQISKISSNSQKRQIALQQIFPKNVRVQVIASGQNGLCSVNFLQLCMVAPSVQIIYLGKQKMQSIGVFGKVVSYS